MPQKMDTGRNPRRRQTESSEEKKIKSRKNIRRILFLNGILLTLMIMVYISTPKKTAYQTSVFEYQGAAVRFSLSEDITTSDIHLSVTFSAENSDLNLTFGADVGEITIRGGKNTVTRMVVGEKTENIILKRGSVKTFTALLNGSDLIKFAKLNPALLEPRMRIRFFFIKQYISFEAALSLSGDKKHFSILKFRYEI